MGSKGGLCYDCSSFYLSISLSLLSLSLSHPLFSSLSRLLSLCLSLVHPSQICMWESHLRFHWLDFLIKDEVKSAGVFSLPANPTPLCQLREIRAFLSFSTKMWKMFLAWKRSERSMSARSPRKSGRAPLPVRLPAGKSSAKPEKWAQERKHTLQPSPDPSHCREWRKQWCHEHQRFSSGDQGLLWWEQNFQSVPPH